MLQGRRSSEAISDGFEMRFKKIISETGKRLLMCVFVLYVFLEQECNNSVIFRLPSFEYRFSNLVESGERGWCCGRT